MYLEWIYIIQVTIIESQYRKIKELDDNTPMRQKKKHMFEMEFPYLPHAKFNIVWKWINVKFAINTVYSTRERKGDLGIHIWLRC